MFKLTPTVGHGKGPEDSVPTVIVCPNSVPDAEPVLHLPIPLISVGSGDVPVTTTLGFP